MSKYFEVTVEVVVATLKNGKDKKNKEDAERESTENKEGKVHIFQSFCFKFVLIYNEYRNKRKERSCR